jgi:PAS domain S-box-containing protein
VSRIVILSDHEEDRRLLAEQLAVRHDVVLPDLARVPDEQFDLCILDGPSLERHWDAVVARREAERPVHLPFLLVSSHQDLTVTTRSVWEAVDGIVITPVHKVELEASVESLLRIRKLSADLGASEQKLRDLVEITSDFLWEIDENNLYTYAGGKVRELLGYEPEEVVGKSPFDLMKPDEAERSAELFRPIAEARKPFSQLENTMVRKDGALVVVLASGVPIFDKSGAYRGYRGLEHDITDRKRTEQELARSNAELQEFAYVASHDLKEPLRMIESYVELLARRYKGKLDANADDFIGFAVDGVQRMQSLIDDLLAYSRVGTKGRPFEPIPLDNALELAIKNLSEAIEETGATVAFDHLPAIQGDESQMIQLLQNLIGNAIKFRGDEPPRVHVSAERAGPEWVISVSDNGIGIAPEYHDRIFQVFERLHSRDEYSGTGIGLAVCRKIVERHGGRIWVESEVGKGSTFYFSVRGERD